MTLITFQDGKVVMRDGVVGTESGCCCGGCSCPDCNGGVTIELNDGASTSDGCGGFDPPEYQAHQLPSDPDNTHGGMSAVMYCEPDAGSPNGIIWRVAASSSWANFGNPNGADFGLFCLKTYAGTVASDENCLPVSGPVELTLVSTDDGGACGNVTEPMVTVQRA